MAEKKPAGWSSWFFGSGGAAAAPPEKPAGAAAGGAGGAKRTSSAASTGGRGKSPAAAGAAAGGPPQQQQQRKNSAPAAGGVPPSKPKQKKDPAALFDGLAVKKKDDAQALAAADQVEATTSTAEEDSSSFAFINEGPQAHAEGTPCMDIAAWHGTARFGCPLTHARTDDAASDGAATASPSAGASPGVSPGGGAVRKRKAAKRPGTYYQEGDQTPSAASGVKPAAAAAAAAGGHASIPTKGSSPSASPAPRQAVATTQHAAERDTKPKRADESSERGDTSPIAQSEVKSAQQQHQQQQAKEDNVDDQLERRKRHEEEKAEAQTQERRRSEERQQRAKEEERKTSQANEKYELVIADARRKLASLDAEREALTQRQKSILGEQRELNRVVLGLQEKLIELDAAQVQALQLEDFENAERLNETIEEVKKDMKGIARQKLRCGEEVLALHVKRSLAAQTEAKLRRSFIDELKALKAEEDERLEAFKSQTSSKFSEEKERIQAKKKGIQKHLTHVRMDLEMLLKSEETVHQSIASQTLSFKEDLHKLNQDRDAVQAEIKELMRLLDQKRREEEELAKQISGLERNVVQVTDRFKNEMERIGIEREAIAKDDHKYTLQMEELKKAKRRLKGEEAKDKEAEKRFQDALDAIESELVSERSAIDALERKEDEQRRAQANYEAFVRMEADQEEQLSSVREQTSTCSAAITQLTARVLSLQQEIHGANQQIVALDARIPSLESEKKLAVSGRNFKEAKRIAEEMKTASVQIEESKETVAALTEQLASCKAALTQHKEQFKVLDQELSSAESKADKVKLQRLRAKEKELLRKLARYDGGQDEETEMSALELESCKSEIAYLRLKWNIQQHDDDGDDDGDHDDVEPAVEVASGIDAAAPPEAESTKSEREEETSEEGSDEAVDSVDPTLDAAAAAEELTALTARVVAWEAELEECVANDDFDRADEVNQEIERAKARSAVLHASLQRAENATSSIPSSAPALEDVGGGSGDDDEPAFAFIPEAENGDDGDSEGTEEAATSEQPPEDQSGFAFISSDDAEATDEGQEAITGTPETDDDGVTVDREPDGAQQQEDVSSSSSSSFAFISHEDHEDSEELQQDASREEAVMEDDNVVEQEDERPRSEEDEVEAVQAKIRAEDEAAGSPENEAAEAEEEATPAPVPATFADGDDASGPSSSSFAFIIGDEEDDQAAADSVSEQPQDSAEGEAPAETGTPIDGEAAGEEEQGGEQGQSEESAFAFIS